LEFFILIILVRIIYKREEARTMKKTIVILSLIFAMILSAQAELSVSLKQLTQVKGVRDNQLQGYGLVVGLDGTGDSNKSLFTIQSIVNLLKNYGVNVNIKDVKVDNIAAVMVTMKLPPFAREGQKYDAVVSSIGDADNLQGGELLQTPLFGADGKVYAVAQGQVSIGGFNVKSGGSAVTKNHPTVGRVINGAIIERDIETEFVKDNKVELMLNNPDFYTAAKIAEAINLWANNKIAIPKDAGAIEINVPTEYQLNPVALLAHLEKITITPPAKSKLIVNTRTGTIVIGENVKLARAAVAHGNLSVVISSSAQVSQPEPLSDGKTVVSQQSDISVTEMGGRVMMLKEGSNIGDVVKALNSIGATPRDVIAIIQALKEAGALYADLELM